MSGRAALILLVLLVGVGVGLGLGINHIMSRGQEIRMSRPPRKIARRNAEREAERNAVRTVRTVRGVPPGKKTVREFMKLVARTNWYQGVGKDFRSKAGAWQDAVAGNRDVVPLVEGDSACDATVAWMLWAKDTAQAKKAGERLLAAGTKAASAKRAGNIYAVLTAAGHPGAARLLPLLKAFAGGEGQPPKPSRASDCALWTEISAKK
jgi:hypothetical protein